MLPERNDVGLCPLSEKTTIIFLINWQSRRANDALIVRCPMGSLPIIDEVHQQMKMTDYAKTSVLAALVLFFALQKGNGGFVFPPLLLIFVVMMFYNVVRMARRPDERKRRGIRLAIWAVTLAIVAVVQIYWDTASRNEADTVITTIFAYKTRTGSYPISLKEVGYDEQALKDKWGMSYYVREGKLVLRYSATLMPLTTYDYDFETHQWQTNAY